MYLWVITGQNENSIIFEADQTDRVVAITVNTVPSSLYEVCA
ncbi:hypothetical protein [Cryobacterium sp. Y57]|nr:hypothetical protein [Cryobacterium sp. Y57]